MAKKKALPAPWEMNQKPTMILAHMNAGELEGLDNLQGGPSIDEETGLREYSHLDGVFDIPEIRQLFIHVMDEVKSKGKISPGMRKIYKTAKQTLKSKFVPTPVEHNKIVHAIEDLGDDPDKHLVWLPESVAQFFLELMPEVDINEKTGLLQFIRIGGIRIGGGGGNPFHEVIRAAGTIGGAVLGGPMGAGLGNALGSAITGKSPIDSAMSGFKNWGLVGGLNTLGNVMAGTPAAGYFAPALGLGGAGGMFGGLGGAGSVGAPYAAGTVAGPYQQGAAPILPGSTGGGSGLGGLFGGGGMGIGGPLLASSVLGYLGEKRAHKEAEKNYRSHLDALKKEREKIVVTGPGREEATYRKGGAVKRAAGGAIAPYNVQSYSEGTLVKGPGKGQDDKIKTSVPSNSYIIDATSVAHFGDGSSEAGAKTLKDFENQIKRKFKHVRLSDKQVKDTIPQVPVWLSNDEYKFDPLTVTMLGGGSNKHGAKLLKRMVRNLRKHKHSNGDGLPPKAKNPAQYMK